eukprot:4026284-Amphidinium_carterae.1
MPSSLSGSSVTGVTSVWRSGTGRGPNSSVAGAASASGGAGNGAITRVTGATISPRHRIPIGFHQTLPHQLHKR